MSSHQAARPARLASVYEFRIPTCRARDAPDPEEAMALVAAQTLEREGLAPTSAADLIAEAHRRAVVTPAAELAARMQELFGQNLTALMAGVENPKTVGRWVRGQEPHPTNLARLRAAFQIASLLELATSRQTVQAWFMGMNPGLGDRAPALVLADGPTDAPRVMRAARAFLAHG